MARIIGHIQAQELKVRIRQSKKVRFSKPLKVDFGEILRRAMEAKRE